MAVETWQSLEVRAALWKWLLAHSLLQSKPGQRTKCKPNRKLVFLRVFKRWARVSEGPPPATSPLGHTETEVQTTAQNHAATRYVGSKGSSCGQGQWRETCHKNGSCLLFQVWLWIKHNDCYFMLITFQMYMTWLWKVLLTLLPAPTTERADKYLLSYYPEQSSVLSCIWYHKAPRSLGFVRAQWKPSHCPALTDTRLMSHCAVSQKTESYCPVRCWLCGQRDHYVVSGQRLPCWSFSSSELQI